jgi:hypothetical protein
MVGVDPFDVASPAQCLQAADMGADEGFGVLALAFEVVMDTLQVPARPVDAIAVGRIGSDVAVSRSWPRDNWSGFDDHVPPNLFDPVRVFKFDVVDPAIDAVDNQVDPLAHLVPGKALPGPDQRSSSLIPRREWRIVAGEEMFLANYSDGLSDLNLAEMIKTFRASGKVACFTAVRPSFSMHLVDMQPGGKVERIRAGQDANLWINGGFFILRKEIFDYMREGDELVEAPFRRLIEADQLMAFRHEGFWRPMDTLKDKQVLEDLVEKGTMPWLINPATQADLVESERKAG